MRHVPEDLTALLDGALAPARRAEVEAHLAACPACRVERDRLAAALGTLEALPRPPEPSPGFEARFRARLARELAGPPRLAERLAALRWRRAAPLAGALAAAAVAAVVVLRERSDRVEMARHLDLLQQYVLVASLGEVDTGEDVEVVAHLDDLQEGRP